MTTLKGIYERRTPAIERAGRQLQSLLAEVVAAIEDKTLVRAEVRSVRLKELPKCRTEGCGEGHGRPKRHSRRAAT